MFWKFNLITTSHIETILSKENVTLQELMDEDDILQECKAQNKNLIDFLVRPEIMEELVTLIISEPVEELEERVRYKYPNTACELLTSDVQPIYDSLAGDESLLAKLYTFIESEKPLNPLLASFFSKTMGILITRKTEVILEFLKSKDGFVNHLVNHLNTSAIMDLLLRLITCVETGKLRTEMLNWLNDQQIIQRLIALIDPTSDEDRHSNASQSLGDIIRFSREQMSQLQDKADPDPLLQTIESSEAVTELLNHMFNGDKNESALVNGISVLLALLEFKKHGANNQTQNNEQSSLYFRPETHEQMTPLDVERMHQGINKSLEALKPRLKEFHQLLIDPPYKPIPTTIGTLEQPLGNTRIHIARLLSSCLSANSQEINLVLATLGTMELLLDLFFKYTWNNFLHTQVEQCIGTILSNPPFEGEDGVLIHPLLTQLFSQCCLIQRIIDAWEDNEQQQAKPGGSRRGYMGHLTKIANHVVQNAEKGETSELIKGQVKELSEDYLQKWETFTSQTLVEINKRNQTPLVGGHPLQSSSEDDDSDFRDIPYPQDTALQQAFSDYQMQQMTSNFIDQFGFNDDEFGDHEENLNGPLERLATVSFNISAEENARNSDLFEQACNERIQAFDDADSDEDIWEDKVQEVGFANVTQQSSITSATRHRPTRDNSDDNSTDSDEDADTPTTPHLPPLPTTPPPAAEEMKMEVDQNDRKFRAWAASFDSIPMDTGNPWDSGHSQHAPPAPTTAASEDTGWANFSDFGNFSQIGGDTASTTPVAMETSESSETSSAFKYLPHNAQRSSQPQVSLPGISGDSAAPTTTSLSTTSTLPVVEMSENEVIVAPVTTVAEATTTTISSSETSIVLVSNDSNSNVVQKEAASEDELTDNFTFLASAGLLKSPSSSSSAEATGVTAPTELSSPGIASLSSSTKLSSTSSSSSQENGPIPLEGGSSLGLAEESASITSGEVSTDPAVEEARSKAKEAFEQLSATMNATSNGPV